MTEIEIQPKEMANVIAAGLLFTGKGVGTDTCRIRYNLIFDDPEIEAYLQAHQPVTFKLGATVSPLYEADDLMEGSSP